MANSNEDHWGPYDHIKAQFTHISEDGRWCHSIPETHTRIDEFVSKYCEVCEEPFCDYNIFKGRVEIFPYPDEETLTFQTCYVEYAICQDCYETMFKRGKYYCYSITREEYNKWVEKIRIPTIKGTEWLDDEE